MDRFLYRVTAQHARWRYQISIAGILFMTVHSAEARLSVRTHERNHHNFVKVPLHLIRQFSSAYRVLSQKPLRWFLQTVEKTLSSREPRTDDFWEGMDATRSCLSKNRFYTAVDEIPSFGVGASTFD